MTSLLDATWASASAPRSRKKLPVSVEDAVRKSLSKNFPGFSEAEKSSLVVQGLTLRERLMKRQGEAVGHG